MCLSWIQPKEDGAAELERGLVAWEVLVAGVASKTHESRREALRERLDSPPHAVGPDRRQTFDQEVTAATKARVSRQLKGWAESAGCNPRKVLLFQRFLQLRARSLSASSVLWEFGKAAAPSHLERRATWPLEWRGYLSPFLATGSARQPLRRASPLRSRRDRPPMSRSLEVQVRQHRRRTGLPPFAVAPSRCPPRPAARTQRTRTE
jgi:hypothetical protein